MARPSRDRELINRDIRFFKDKSPYKDHLDLWFWTGDRKGWDASGFFFRLTPDRPMAGAVPNDTRPPSASNRHIASCVPRYPDRRTQRTTSK
ncbi:MAG TPA: DUF2461 family protein [Polyangia bacterium]|nr:DUF2461 family protein [Polyangia bacterium]